jgi:hypothetical protein
LPQSGSHQIDDFGVHVITDAGMWGKAGKLFAEMGLERDLEELLRVRLEM